LAYRPARPDLISVFNGGTTKAKVEDDDQADPDPKNAMDQLPATDFVGGVPKISQKGGNGRGRTTCRYG
jgi:hypothetical protein